MLEMRAKKASHSSRSGNGARSTVMCALAGTRNRTTSFTEISFQMRVLLVSVATRIIDVLVKRSRVTKPVAIAAHVTELRFFQPTTSFAFSSVQMSSQETINFWGMFVMMLNATVRTRNVCTMRREKAVHANFPVHL